MNSDKINNDLRSMNFLKFENDYLNRLYTNVGKIYSFSLFWRFSRPCKIKYMFFFWSLTGPSPLRGAQLCPICHGRRRVTRPKMSLFLNLAGLFSNHIVDQWECYWASKSFLRCISSDTKWFEYTLERNEQTLTQLHS